MKNTFSLILLFLPIVLNSQLKINELSAHKGFSDLNIENDWIELINTGMDPLDLSDLYITDDLDELQKWQLPNYTMQPAEILLICASGKDINTNPDHWESLVVAENEWKYIPGNVAPPNDWAQVNFDDSAWGVGMGGFGYGDDDDNTEVSNVWSVYIRKEFEINDLSDLQKVIFHADYDDAYVAYLNGFEFSRSDNIEGQPPAFNTTATELHEALLYQNEIPESLEFDQDDISNSLVDGTNVLAVQIHNEALFSSDLSGNFFLSAGILSNSNNYQATPTWFPPSNELDFFHSNFKLDPGESLAISDEGGAILDLLIIPEDLRYEISFGRSPDGVGQLCYFDQPSPGGTNTISWCYDGVAQKPEFSLPSGWYSGTQITSLSSTSETIRFTTNGDIPDETSSIYTNNILMNNDKIVSAKAFSSGNLLPSDVVDRTYIFNEDNYDLPVLSIHTDIDNLWSWEEGIYVSGPDASPTYPYFDSNFWKPWTKFSRLEFFNGAKEKLAEEQMNLSIHGGWSRAEPQKSFRFDFRSEYTGRLELPLFSQKPFIENVNNINIRAGGQHVNTDKIQDGLVSRLINGTNVDNMAYEPCIVYLNGDYWGIYGIREKIDEHYIESNHGVPSNEVDLLNSFGTLEGSNAHLIQAYLEIISLPVSSPLFFDLLSEKFDIDNYIDYFIIQTYIQNLDWLGIAWGTNNVKLWRPQTETGKWRYVIYDTDAGLGGFGQSVFGNYLAFAQDPAVPNIHSQIFDKALDNNEFKCRFAQRYADLVNTIFQPENFSAKASEISLQIVDAMQDQVDNWNAPPSVPEWQEMVNSIVEYNTNRIPYARSHVNTELALNGQKNIDLNVNPPNSGKIKISTIVPENYPWEGVYFDGCPIEIDAIPEEGFAFDHWSENDLIPGGSTDQELYLNLSQNVTFVANFVQISTSIDDLENPFDLEVFPNPSSGTFNISLSSIQREDLVINIYDLNGRKVLRDLYSDVLGELKFEIDLDKNAKGIYQLEISSSKDQTIKKLVLE